MCAECVEAALSLLGLAGATVRMPLSEATEGTACA